LDLSSIFEDEAHSSQLGHLEEHDWDLRSIGREAPKGNAGIQDGSHRLKLTHRWGRGQHLIRPRISHQSPEYGGPNHHLGSVSAPARNPDGNWPSRTSRLIFSERRRTPGITLAA
jgi:hypothetical protein